MKATGLGLLILSAGFMAGAIAHYGWCWSGCAASGDYSSRILGYVIGTGLALCFISDIRSIFPKKS